MFFDVIDRLTQQLRGKFDKKNLFHKLANNDNFRNRIRLACTGVSATCLLSTALFTDTGKLYTSGNFIHFGTLHVLFSLLMFFPFTPMASVVFYIDRMSLHGSSFIYIRQDVIHV